MTVTYDSGTNTFTVTDGIEATPITMEDVYTYSYNNSIMVSGEPAVLSDSSVQYHLNSNLTVGDVGGTSTYCTLLNDSVFFANSYVPKVLASATFDV